MPHIVDMDLTPAFSPADFRLHPGAEPVEPHWLIKHPYGRDLLACKLRQMRPDVKFMHYRIDRALFPFLESMIDLLGLRDWPAPVTVRERLTTSLMLLRMVFAFQMQRELPHWRAGRDRSLQ